MKLAIIIIALLGLSMAADTAYVSATTKLAKTYQAAAQQSAQTASTNLQNAAAALTKAETDRKAAQVPTSTWTNFANARKAVDTAVTAVATQDTALAALVLTASNAANTLATSQVANQCQVLTAATRVNWQTLSKTMTTDSASAYGTAKTAFAVPTPNDFTTLGTDLKASLDAMDSYITSQLTLAYGTSGTDTAPTDLAVTWWTGNNGQTVVPVNALSYQGLKCPYYNSIICKNCDAPSVAEAQSLFTKEAWVTTNCKWEKLAGWAQAINQQYTAMTSTYNAMGQWTFLDNVNKLKLSVATNGVTVRRDAYATKLTDFGTSVTNFKAQVDKLAALLLQMQQTSKAAKDNAQLLVTSTTAVADAAKVIMDAASTAATQEQNKVAALKTTSDAALLAANNQWTTVNTTLGALTKQMQATRGAVGALQGANAQLAGALKAQGVAHELSTSSAATDQWAKDQQAQFAAMTKLSKTDYDNVVVLKKASGSSMIQTTVTLIAGFAILMGYRKF